MIDSDGYQGGELSEAGAFEEAKSLFSLIRFKV